MWSWIFSVWTEPHALRRLGLCWALLACTAALAQGSAPVSRWVNPFIGTDCTGHTTPAAAVPFGMVMPGPDHAERGWSYSSGYQ
jgi:putative alpha-1,2-mannosidase